MDRTYNLRKKRRDRGEERKEEKTEEERRGKRRGEERGEERTVVMLFLAGLSAYSHCTSVTTTLNQTARPIKLTPALNFIRGETVAHRQRKARD